MLTLRSEMALGAQGFFAGMLEGQAGFIDSCRHFNPLRLEFLNRLVIGLHKATVVTACMKGRGCPQA